MATLAANTTVIERRWTAAEYMRLPEGPPYYELEDGELIEMVRPRRMHQEIIGELYAVISPYVRRERLGRIWPEVAVFLTPRHIYVPDLSFLLTEHLARFAEGVAIEGPPDLVVEVISPSTAARDRSRKLRTYHAAGVPWYWLVESDTLLITEYRHTAEGYLVSQTIPATEPFAPGLLPGLSFKMAELLEMPAEEKETRDHE